MRFLGRAVGAYFLAQINDLRPTKSKNIRFPGIFSQCHPL
jgi:hypothetical protein